MSPFSEPFTQTLLQKGLHQGMRVLDIGCGTGEVSALAAYIVGETGSVLGIDSMPKPLKPHKTIILCHTCAFRQPI